MTAYVELLKNVLYRTEQGAACRFVVLGPGAVRCEWLTDSTDKDMTEVTEWMRRILSIGDVTEYRGAAEGEQGALDSFYKQEKRKLQ